MLNRQRRLIHSSHVKFVVNMFASWCMVPTYLMCISGVQINSVKQPIKSNSVGSGHMSHSWTSAFDDQSRLHYPQRCTASHQIEKTSRSTAQSTLFRSKLSCWVGTLVLFLVCLFDVVSPDKFPCT